MEDLYIVQDFLLNTPIDTIGIITGQVPESPYISNSSKKGEVIELSKLSSTIRLPGS